LTFIDSEKHFKDHGSFYWKFTILYNIKDRTMKYNLNLWGD